MSPWIERLGQAEWTPSSVYCFWAISLAHYIFGKLLTYSQHDLYTKNISRYKRKFKGPKR